MACNIKNISSRLVSIPGNSGQVWHIPPGSAIDVMDVEVIDNAKVKKLEAQNIIALGTSQEAAPHGQAKHPGRKSSVTSTATSSKGE